MTTETTTTIEKFKERAIGCPKMELVGLTIQEALRRLGRWWTIEAQSVSSCGGGYRLRGTVAGLWSLNLLTDERDVITQVG